MEEEKDKKENKEHESHHEHSHENKEQHETSHEHKEHHEQKEHHHESKHEHHETPHDSRHWYDKYYKHILVIPIIVLILSMVYLGFFLFKHGDLMYKDASLTGGTTITINIPNLDQANLESQLKKSFPDVTIRKLTDLTTGKALSFIIESEAKPEDLKSKIEEAINAKLTNDNSSTEFTGPTLSQSFYRQLILALIISFILMSITIFIIFRTFVPSLAVIFAAFADIVMPLALIDLFGIKLSAAGIAAFLMLIGYSVDTDVLLTTRAIRTKDGRDLNGRIYRAFKTGIFMTISALIAVLPAFVIVTNLPDSFRQIFLILTFGLFADIFNTWLTNASIIKWYCEVKGIK